MKFIGSAFGYVFKNFLFIFLFALIPSYFYAMSLDLNNIHALTDSLFSGENPEFLQIFDFISFVNGKRWVFSLVCFVTLLACLAMLFGLIEKHMRIGSRSYKGVAGRFNTNILSTLAVGLVILAVYELWSLIASGFIFMITFLLDGLACTVAVCVAYFGMVAIICWIMSVLLLWLPSLLITGFSFMDALSYSNQLYGGSRGGLFLAVYLPCAAGAVVELLVAGVFGPGNVQVPVFVIMELLFIILILYYSALMFTAYFRLAGEERADLRKKY